MSIQGANLHSGEGGHAKRVLASPLARRLARQRGIDLGKLRGSGPKGRIVKRDIPLAAAEARITEPAEAIEAVEAMPEPERRLTLSRPAPAAGLTDKQVLAL